MERFFIEVLNISLSGSIAIAAVLLLRLILRKAPKKYSYMLWVIVLFRLVCPFTFELPAGSVPQVPDLAAQYENQYQRPAMNTLTPFLPAASDYIPQQEDGVINDDGAGVSAVHVHTVTPIEIAGFVWIAGVFCLLGYSLLTVVKLKRRLRSAESIQQNIFEVQNLKTPFVLGVFRPEIYLPMGLSETERRYILAHEQAHICRADHIVKLLYFFVLSIHWFNPLVWLSFALMSRDMELSVDEKVLEKLGNDIKNDYSQSLLRLSVDKRFLTGSPLAFGEGDIKNRVKNVLGYKKPVLWISVAALVVVVASGILFFGKPAGNDQSPDPVSEQPSQDGTDGDAAQAQNAPRADSVKMILWYEQSTYNEGVISDPQQIAELTEMFEDLNYEDTSRPPEYPRMEIRFQRGDSEELWVIDKNQVASGSVLGSGSKAVTGDEDIYDKLVDILNGALKQPQQAERARLSLTLDGQALETSDRFYIKQQYSHYLNVMELSQLLGFETVCAADQPIEKNSVTIPAGTIAVFYDGYVTTLALGDSYAVTTKIGEIEPSYYPWTAAPVFFEGEYYVDVLSLPYLFFVGLDTPLPEDDGFLEDAQLISLDAQIETAKAYIEGRGYVYTPTGNPFYDRQVLTDEVVAHTKKGDADSVFWMNSDKMIMGPIMSHLTHTDFGYIRSMNDRDGHTYYGLYSQAFDHETLPLEYTEIKCIDYRARFLSLATGFGANRRYGGAHIAPGFSTATLIPVTSKTPLTAEYMRDYVLSQGVPLEGEWSGAIYTSTIYSDDFVTENRPDEAKNGATIGFLHPFYWSFSYYGAIDSDMSLYDGIQPVELKLRPGKTWIIQSADFLRLEKDFYRILYPDEQDKIISSEAYALEGRRIYRYALSQSMADGKRMYYPVHYFIYFDSGELCDITLYGLNDHDAYEQASFKRIIESMSFGGLWYNP